MSPTLPNECLHEIFSYLDNDLKTLHSAIFVSHVWCENAIPFLWKKPFRQNPKEINLFKIIPIFLSFLKNQKKDDLQLENISTFKLPTKTTFDYPFFIQHLDLNYLITAVTQWLIKYPPINETSLFYYKRTKKEISIDYLKRNDFVVSILITIITISEKIEKLEINMDKELDVNIVEEITKFFAIPETFKCLSQLTHLEFSGKVFLTGIISELSNYAHELISIKFCPSEEIPGESYKEFANLILTQKNLKYLRLEWPSRKFNATQILLSLSNSVNSLLEFTMINGCVTDGRAFESLADCSNLELLHFNGQHFTVEQMKPFYDANMPKLYSLQLIDLYDRIDRISQLPPRMTTTTTTNITNPYIGIFQNTRMSSNLRNLCIRTKGMSLHSILEAVSRICQNFISFTTYMIKNEDKNFILSIIRNSPRLESLEILAIDEIFVDFISFIPLALPSPPLCRDGNDLLLEMVKVLPNGLRHLNISQLEILDGTLKYFLEKCEAKLKSLIYYSNHILNDEEFIKKISDEKGWKVKQIDSINVGENVRIIVLWE
ncbi:2541_t:CDS:1 [Diversispora eburnea]|uniref:2541_t:CDS:1 n=1 Tax=Diversispora eburnea TaxID=1213867 RepID=A0A9N8ZRD7_9GLOM|nr:2541_t:CDS:1 [Diversispora eburnea]